MQYVSFFLLFLSAFAYGNTSLKLSELRQQYEEKAFTLKKTEEKKAIALAGKTDFLFFNEVLKSGSTKMSCVEFVYQGSASREEAVEACRGVRSMDCVNFAYKGASNREQSAVLCQNVQTFECVEFLYKGLTTSREEAIRSCRGYVDMKCVNFMYAGTATRFQAVEKCREERRDPRDCY